MSVQEELDGADLVEHDVRHEDISPGGNHPNFIRIDINSLKLQLEKQLRPHARGSSNRMNSATQTDSPTKLLNDLSLTSNKESASSVSLNDPKVLTAWMSDDEKDMIARRVPK